MQSTIPGFYRAGRQRKSTAPKPGNGRFRWGDIERHALKYLAEKYHRPSGQPDWNLINPIFTKIFEDGLRACGCSNQPENSMLNFQWGEIKRSAERKTGWELIEDFPLSRAQREKRIVAIRRVEAVELAMEQQRQVAALINAHVDDMPPIDNAKLYSEAKAQAKQEDVESRLVRLTEDEACCVLSAMFPKVLEEGTLELFSFVVEEASSLEAAVEDLVATYNNGGRPEFVLFEAFDHVKSPLTRKSTIFAKIASCLRFRNNPQMVHERLLENDREHSEQIIWKVDSTTDLDTALIDEQTATYHYGGRLGQIKVNDQDTGLSAFFELMICEDDMCYSCTPDLVPSVHTVSPSGGLPFAHTCDLILWTSLANPDRDVEHQQEILFQPTEHGTDEEKALPRCRRLSIRVSSGRHVDAAICYAGSCEVRKNKRGIEVLRDEMQKRGAGR